jgi:NADPH-dependent ferric siderophore reductase
MASLKAILRDSLAQLVFKEFSIDDIRDVSPHFRRLRVSGQSLRAGACAAGDKLQVMIPEAGPRTFSPFAHDPAAGTIELLAYVHGDTPAARWARQQRSGASLRAFGPRGSLPLASLSGPVVMFGDETSFAAAKALLDTRGQHEDLAFVFECTDERESQVALADLGIPRPSLVQRQAALTHLDAVETHVRADLTRLAQARLILTGHAQTIQALRSRLKTRPASYTAQKVKAYWADGKQGLD